MNNQWKNDPVWGMRPNLREHEESAIDHEKVHLARQVRLLEHENARLKELNRVLEKELEKLKDDYFYLNRKYQGR